MGKPRAAICLGLGLALATAIRSPQLAPPTMLLGTVALSGDGTLLVASRYRMVPGDWPPKDQRLHLSRDFGRTWIPVPAIGNWTDIATSHDGKVIVAVANEGDLIVSNDGGHTWVRREQRREWTAVASSADGTKLLAAAAMQLFLSNDAGATWSALSGVGETEARELEALGQHASDVPVPRWEGVATSTAGSKLTAVGMVGHVYVSDNGGQTWSAPVRSRCLTYDLSVSGDAKKLAMACSGGISGAQVASVVSVDGGVTWQQLLDGEEELSGTAVFSADGSTLAVMTTTSIYVSRDDGAHWRTFRIHEPNKFGFYFGYGVFLVSISGDGSRIAAVNDGRLFTSTDRGATWKPH